MANKSHGNILTDKAIRELPIKEKPYLKVCGEPKELYIRVNPNGKKSFFIWYKENGYKKRCLLKEFREGIYSIAEARKEALDKLKELESGKTIDQLKRRNKGEFTFGRYFDKFIKSKKILGREDKTIRKIITRHESWTLPSLKNVDVREIERHPAMLKDITDLMHEKGIAETRQRLSNELLSIFDIAIKEREIIYNPAYGLKDYYPTPAEIAKKLGKSLHYAALIEKDDIKEFIKDLKWWQPRNGLHCKHAIYLQILTANRPSNTAKAKWADIDLENGIWTIPAYEMKMRTEHIVALSSYAIKILKKQKVLSGNFEYVFPSTNGQGKLTHLSIDGIRKAIVNLGYKGKWFKRTTAHGFRATFDTICELNSDKINNMGLPNRTPEVALSHQEKNAVKKAYIRKRAEIDDLKILMQWYADYLNSIEPLGI